MSQIKVDAIEPRTAGGNIAVDTDTLVVDTTNNRVGIGTSSPNTKAEISTNSESSILRLTDTATIGSANRKVGGIEFYQNDASGGAGIGSSIESYHVNVSGDTDLRFATGNNTERMRILSSGGLTFNGDTAAANALDDYEEGTWTPTSANGIGTLTSINARYVKVGRKVTAVANFVGTSSSAFVYIGGLPFSTSTHCSASFTNNSWEDCGARTAGTTVYGRFPTTGTRTWFISTTYET